MKKLLFAVAASAAFFVGSAQAQNAGTVTNHAFAVGKGVGIAGYTSVVCPSGNMPIGQAGDPICQPITGDVTITTGGVTAIGANKVQNTQLRTSGALSLIGRSANSTGNVADISAAPGSSCVFMENAGTLTCANIGTANISASAVTNAKLANMAAWTIKGNGTSGAAAPTDFTIDGLTLKASPASTDEVWIWDVAGAAWKKTTVSALSSAGSVGSLNTKTGALTLAINKQVFAVSGTYSPSAGLLFAVAECVGSGGGAGNANGTTSDQFVGGGGGSGGYSRAYLSAATIGGSQPVTVNNAGTGGVAGATVGGTAGGDVSLGTLCVGKGGAGGNYCAVGNSACAGGAGGVAGTGDVTAAGQAGFGGMFLTVTTVVPSGLGAGGNSYFGGAGAGVNPNAAGNAAGNYGSGGSAGYASNTTSNFAGGNGSKGVVIITEYTLN